MSLGPWVHWQRGFAMNVFHPSGRSLGFLDDTRFALTIARQGRGAGFAPRASRYSSYDEEGEREERPRRSSSQVGTSWLIAGFVLAVGVVIVLIVAVRGGQENLLSLQEFQDRISIFQGGVRVYPAMSTRDFVSRIGCLPIQGRDFDDANCYYHYYKVKEGVVEVAFDKPSWKMNVARVVRVSMP